MLRPHLIEVRLQVLAILLSLEASELLDDQGSSLIRLVFLDHTDAVVAILRELLEQILQVFIIRGSI